MILFLYSIIYRVGFDIKGDMIYFLVNITFRKMSSPHLLSELADMQPSIKTTLDNNISLL
jgi:hypothetical protein